MSTNFFYLNLSKIFHFYFLKQKERKYKLFNDKEDVVEFQH